jgi:ribulose-5-phosphate 4-epimerase/fuculose-1-phosphate aldolase
VDNPRFIVTGSQTGKYPHLKPRHYSLVEKSFPQENRVMASGPSKPSSESMTHAIVYRLDPTAQVVIHVHAPLLWKNARRLGLPMTRRNVHYGTPEMAAEVIRLFKTRQLRTKKIFSMSGHLDGVISFGSTADEAGLRLIDYAMRSYSFHATTSS